MIDSIYWIINHLIRTIVFTIINIWTLIHSTHHSSTQNDSSGHSQARIDCPCLPLPHSTQRNTWLLQYFESSMLLSWSVPSISAFTPWPNSALWANYICLCISSYECLLSWPQMQVQLLLMRESAGEWAAPDNFRNNVSQNRFVGWAFLCLMSFMLLWWVDIAFFLLQCTYQSTRLPLRVCLALMMRLRLREVVS